MPSIDPNAHHCPGSDQLSIKSLAAGIDRAVSNGCALYAVMSSRSGLLLRNASGATAAGSRPGSHVISCDVAGVLPLLLPPLAELRFDSLDGRGSVPAGADRRRTLYCSPLRSGGLTVSGCTGGGKAAGCCCCTLLGVASGSCTIEAGAAGTLLVGVPGAALASVAGAA